MAKGRWAKLTVGGAITAAQKAEIVRLMMKDGQVVTRNGSLVMLEDGIMLKQGKLVDDGLGTLSVESEGVPNRHIEFSATMKYLREQNIPFNFQWEHCEVNGYQIDTYRDGEKTWASEPCTREGEILIPLRKLRRLLLGDSSRGKTVEQYVNQVQEAMALPILFVDGQAAGYFQLVADDDGRMIVSYSIRDGHVSTCTGRAFKIEGIITSPSHWVDRNGLRVTDPSLLSVLNNYWQSDYYLQDIDDDKDDPYTDL